MRTSQLITFLTLPLINDLLFTHPGQATLQINCLLTLILT